MTTNINSRQIIDIPLGEKDILWISDVNRYIIAEKWSAQIILQLNANIDIETIASRVALEDELEDKEALELVQAIRDIWTDKINKIEIELQELNAEADFFDFYSKRTYAINGLIFEVEYQTTYAEWINHPKFAHLETDTWVKPDHVFRIGDFKGYLSIWVDGRHEGTWKHEDNHFLSGRFSMKMIEKIYQKEEKEWMGVFHAAGISNGKQCLLFFGDSGNGKSTLSALAMAAGLDILSDDFLPVESNSGLVHNFPAALSIKKNAYDLVKTIFPELIDAYEYENPAFGKIYRYLAPRETSKTAIPCKAIVEVKYDANISFNLEPITLEDAFARLIPDSWINASAENAKNFISWFKSKSHFRLTYSDNEKMIAAIKQLLDD